MERVLSNFGSRHRVSRRFVIVDDIYEIDPSKSTAPRVVAHFEFLTLTAPNKSLRKNKGPFRRFLRA